MVGRRQDRPGSPFFLLRSYHRYSIDNRWQTFNSSHCAVNADIDQKTFFCFFLVLLYALYIDKDNLLLPLHQNDDRSCLVLQWESSARVWTKNIPGAVPEPKYFIIRHSYIVLSFVLSSHIHAQKIIRQADFLTPQLVLEHYGFIHKKRKTTYCWKHSFKRTVNLFQTLVRYIYLTKLLFIGL